MTIRVNLPQPTADAALNTILSHGATLIDADTLMDLATKSLKDELLLDFAYSRPLPKKGSAKWLVLNVFLAERKLTVDVISGVDDAQDHAVSEN